LCCSGLDALLEKYIYSVQDLLRTPLENLSFAAPPFKYIFEVRYLPRASVIAI
jgi:hypothetical protein